MGNPPFALGGMRRRIESCRTNQIFRRDPDRWLPCEKSRSAPPPQRATTRLWLVSRDRPERGGLETPAEIVVLSEIGAPAGARCHARAAVIGESRHPRRRS